MSYFLQLFVVNFHQLFDKRNIYQDFCAKTGLFKSSTVHYVRFGMVNILNQSITNIKNQANQITSGIHSGDGNANCMAELTFSCATDCFTEPCHNKRY